MTEGSGDTNCDPIHAFVKHSSYTEEYHQKYFYPRVVEERVAVRISNESSDERVVESKGQFDKGKKVVGKLDQSLLNVNEEVGALVHEQSNNVSQSSACGKASRTCSWFLSPAEQYPPQGVGLVAHDQSTKYPGVHENSLSHTLCNKLAMESTENKQPVFPALGDKPESWEDMVQSSTGRVSSESITSEDSVFSEDYTAMTDNVEFDVDELELPQNQHGLRRTPAEGSEDADSSFSSPGSSTSTLEADGNEDGGNVEVARKDKVVEDVSDSLKHSARKTNPNIKLLLPPINVTDGTSASTSDADMERFTGASVLDTDNGAEGCEPRTSKPRIKNSDSTSFYEDREFDFLKTEPVRRSTSLKTYKTPPGTPHRKKGVRFADALGLDLESVRHILNLEEPPEVPKSAMKDLLLGMEEDRQTEGVKYLSALFSQPGVDPSFMTRVQDSKVVLENCLVNDTDMTISGTVRVANVSYHKKVIVRYTTNGWVSSDDVVSNYVQNSNDGQSDRFSFTLNVPKYFAVGQRLEFAIMYHAETQNFWDNNCGQNYAVECYARSMPVSHSDNSWMHFL